jgi:hypothetical protein
MPADRRSATDTDTLEDQVDGVLVAPLERGSRWAGLRALRAGMSRLRDEGLRPTVAYVLALASDGRIVPPRGGEAAVFLLGYRLESL